MAQPPMMAAGTNPANINTAPAGSLPAGTGMVPSQTHNPNYGQNGNEFSYRSKVLLGMLKAAVENVVDIATKTIVQNSALDNGTTSGKAPESEEMSECRFEKSLEEFYATCNQIEIHLRTVLESNIQTRDSNNFLPFTISKELEVPHSTMSNTVSYSDYLNIIKKQVTYTKSVFDILADSSRQIRGEPPMMPPQQSLQQHQHQLPPMHLPQQQQQQQIPFQHLGPMPVGQSMSHQVQQPPQ